MNPNYRSVVLWGVIAVVIIALFSMFQGTGPRGSGDQISYSDFLTRVDNKQVKKVTLEGQSISGETNDGRFFKTIAPKGEQVADRLQSQNVEITVNAESTGSNPFVSILSAAIPIIILVAIWVFFMRQMQGGSRGAMGFGKSKAKLLTEAHGRVTFEDVAGVEEAKDDLEEVVEFLRDPQKFQRLGARIPRGVLLVGPPGTGKTLLARAVAGEANVPFFTISGSDFVEMFVGVGASRVRDMFEQGKKNSPCIIFIDEIDAVGRHRGAGIGGGNDEREQTLNQLLVEMDGFEANENVIIIAATNRPDVLDPALLRPGRFDRQVVVPNPDVAGREQILQVHVRNVPLAPNVDLKVLARGTPGFSGADLMNLVNEAALMAARRNKRLVTMQEFEDAKDKILMGAERRSTAMTQREKENTAYHEAGHAVVALNVPATDPVHKATIIPRGRALGMVMQLPENDRYSMTYQSMISRLAILMAGRIAEEMKFGTENITSGASSDIEQATKLARAMVTKWGFSDKLGKVAYGGGQDEGYGYGGQRHDATSEHTAQIIDMEVRRIIDEAHDEAKRILTEKKDEWTRLAEGLLEYETLTGEEIIEVMAGNVPSRNLGNETSRSSGVPKAGRSVKVDIEKPKADEPVEENKASGDTQNENGQSDNAPNENNSDKDSSKS